MARGEVEWSVDLQRILELPRRERPELGPLVREMTQRLRKPGGTQTLREIQAWALWEAPQAGGLVALIQTGGGKTLPLMLMPMVFPPIQNEDGSYRPIRAVVFVPPDLKPQFLADYETYGRHWRLPNLAGGKWFTPGLPVLHVVAYSELSSTKSSALLTRIQPDLVMGDEISSVRNFETSRTRRLRAYMGQFPDSRFVGMDATIVSDSVEDFWAPLIWAFDENAPVPVEQSEMKKWARAIDPQSYGNDYFMPGALMRLCEAGEKVRSGFQRRLSDTLGVVATRENALGIPLHFIKRVPPPMPEEIRKHLANLRRKPDNGGWKRPDGEEFQDDAQVAACARQLAEGCWLYWHFPRGEPDDVIDLWFKCRQNYNREVRSQLFRATTHMDSPKLLENAAARWFDGGCTGCSRGPEQFHATDCREKESHPLWESSTFLKWREVEDTVVHESRVKWESDWLLKDAAEWALETPGIVWTDRPAFAHRLAKMTGLRYYGGGDEANEEITVEFAEERGRSAKSIICSVNSNKKGKNLQFAFNRSLIISFPSTNDVVEQLIGRTLRPGQSEPVVEVHYYMHTPELENALDNAMIDARFVKETVGNDQKLCYGIWS